MRAGKGIKAQKTKTLVFAVATIALSIMLFLGLAEVALRFLPVATGLRTMAVTQQSPVFRLMQNQDYVYSRDWNFSLANRGRVNNAGFVNAQDYARNGAPLLAVIGDSYIEALMVPYARTVHGRTAVALEGNCRVYSFAASGAPLSQYLIWSRHAVREFGAQALLINVVGNDFDESHMNYRVSQGFWLYAPQPDGALKLTLTEYQPGVTRKATQYSALLRYLSHNLRVQEAVPNLADLAGRWSAWFSSKPAGVPVFAGNTAAKANEIRIRASLAAVDAFLNDLPVMTGLPVDRIAFTLDGFRYPEAVANGAGTYFDRMRREFAARAEAKGYEVIDLDPFFHAHYRQHRRPFEFPRDGHWNSTAHGVAADAALGSRVVRALCP